MLALRTNTPSTCWEPLSTTEPPAGAPIDANGNLTSDGTRTFDWDARNQLIRVRSGQTELESYEYDGRGRRTSVNTATGSRWIVNADRHAAEERDVATGAITRLVRGPGIDKWFGHVEPGGAVHFYVSDHLGSIVAETDASGGTLRTTTYDPWGNAVNSGVDARYTFTGREWDSDAQLNYNRARYYDPKLGRFISEDPAGFFTGDPNVYAYVQNSPDNFTDPWGLWKYHGNWCGPNWTGGQKGVYDPTNQNYLPPTDALDSACKTHDICYYKCRKNFPCDKKARGECMTRCDRDLSADSAFSGHSTGSPLWWWMNNNNWPDPGDNDPSCDRCGK